VLQERLIQPVGGQRTIPVDVRVISATHQDLEAAIQEGRFRQDLYYRLKGVELRVPPLRARRDDILLLANSFLVRSQGVDLPVPEISPQAIDALLRHTWPGNVRELEHSILRAVAMHEGSTVEPADLGLNSVEAPSEHSWLAEYLGLPLAEAKSRLVDTLERTLIVVALDATSGNVSEAARRLGMHRQSLQQKMTQLGIRR
jgi:DNA-binding NtrC family response regulator